MFTMFTKFTPISICFRYHLSSQRKQHSKVPGFLHSAGFIGFYDSAVSVC
jgi:hypothetical protein